jgi:hypothetical protein
MTKSLDTPRMKNSACDPETYECLYELQNDPCDYYQKISYKKSSHCKYLGIHGCWNTQAWLNDQA